MPSSDSEPPVGRRRRSAVPGTSAAPVETAARATPRPRKTAGAKREAQRAAVTAAFELRSKMMVEVFKGLTAAADLMDPKGKNAPHPNAATRTWQHAAWGYGRTVPELHMAMLFVGNCLSQVTLKPGKRQADGSVDISFDGSEDAVEGLPSDVVADACDIVSRIRSTSGGQSEFLRSTSEKLFMAGELYWLPKDAPNGGLTTFDVLSTQELLPSGAGYVIFWGPGYEEQPLAEDVQPIRVYRRDAQFGKLADSSVRSCLEILEELVILTRLVRASAISRMALAGVLLLPDTLDSPQEDADADGATAEAMNPLATDMTNTGSKAIDDPASAAAWMPYILQGEASDLKEVRHLPFERDDALNVVKRQEALERLAQGLDLPVEVILSHRETTFANARQISEDTFKLHLLPTIQLICDAATQEILWPALAQRRGLTPEQVAEGGYPDEILSVAVTYDATRLISRPDRAKDIVEAFKADPSQMLLALRTVRAALGVDPEEEPDDEEIAKRVDAIRLTKIREVIAAPPGDAAVPIDQASAGNAVVPGQSGGAQAIEATATESANTAAQQEQVKQAALANRIAGAAELIIERSAEKIGAKLRTKARGIEKDAIAGIPNADVAAILGPRAVTTLLDDGNPFDAELAAFTRAVARWAAEAGADNPGEIAERAGLIVARFVQDRLYGQQRPVTYELTSTLVQ